MENLRIKEEVTDDNTLNLLFDVVDTGCGIKEEVLPRLFGQFEQADATVVSKHGGSGLGLSIVKHLVSEMNGTIDVHSKYQTGSKFSVSIPLKIAESDILYENKLEKQTALIVFNDAESLNCISKMLNSWNVKNIGFTSSLKALEYIKKNPQSHTIYIFDLKLPDLDGFGLTKAVRTLSKATIIIANYDFNELKEKNNNRATAFIQKPIFKSTLYNYIVNKEANDIINVNNTNLVRYDGFKVLSVEDNKINQMIIKNILNKVGINVFTASNGLEAIEFIKTNEEGDNLDLIFMDIRMPDMDGITATKEIRKFNTTTPIIALSANAFEEDIKRSNEAGMNNHLSKPIDKILLNEILKTYLIKKD